MKLKIHHVDAFTDTVFKGNFAAVIVTEQWLDDELMQSIAAENNLSETAFVKYNANNEYGIRWFSPITEVDFCGHATLAAAYVLFLHHTDIDSLCFTSDSVGPLNVARGDNGDIVMTFPNQMPHAIDTIPEALVQGLSIPPEEILLNQQAYFAIYPDEQSVRSVEIDEQRIKQLAPFDVVVTSKGTKYDFICRYFWPANGGYEDPVTGSIHAGLAPLWAQRLAKQELVAYQASARGGVLKCTVSDNQVIIAGKGALYLEGDIHV